MNTSRPVFLLAATFLLSLLTPLGHAETVVEQWAKRYNGTGDSLDFANAVAVDSAGNVIVTGATNDGGYYVDYFTAKYAAADGALIWMKRWDGPDSGPAIATAIAVDSPGNVIVTGYSSEGSYTAKYSAANGALIWESHHITGALALDSAGNVIVAGSATAKYAAADGALLWEKTGPIAKAVAVDGAGNAIVTGSYTAKYAAADGTLLWEKRYYGGFGSAQAVAMDSAGNVIVTGNSRGDNSGSDYATRRGHRRRSRRPARPVGARALRHHGWARCARRCRSRWPRGNCSRWLLPATHSYLTPTRGRSSLRKGAISPSHSPNNPA